MKSSTSRDAMTARVNETFGKWPSFNAMPETKNAGRRTPVNGDPNDQQNYVKALYSCCAESIPLGRDGAAIVGEPVSVELDVEWTASGGERGNSTGLRLKAR